MFAKKSVKVTDSAGLKHLDGAQKVKLMNSLLHDTTSYLTAGDR